MFTTSKHLVNFIRIVQILKYHNNNEFVHDWSLLSLKKSAIELLFSIIYQFFGQGWNNILHKNHINC